jgi:hypothetical protein
MKTIMIDEFLIKRFKEKYKIDPLTECWNWTAAKTLKGYGQIKINGKLELAGRISYLIHTGNINDNAWVGRLCDNPACVNPKHLYLCSRSKRMSDSGFKKRLRGQDDTKIKTIRQLRYGAVIVDKFGNTYKDVLAFKKAFKINYSINFIQNQLINGFSGRYNDAKFL